MWQYLNRDLNKILKEPLKNKDNILYMYVHLYI